MNKKRKTIWLWILVAVVIISAGAAWVVTAEQKKKAEYEKKERQYWLHHWEELDSLYKAEKAMRDSLALVTPKKSNEESDDYSTNRGSYHSSGYDDSYTGPASSCSSGTSPDDGMYGFDPLDDRDDEYNDDHFQQDAYPDDDY